MMPMTLRDPAIQLLLGLIAAATALLWVALLVAPPLGWTFLCGAYGPDDAFAPLVVRWQQMSLLMMLPCTAMGALRAAWNGRAGNIWAGSSFAGGYLAVAAAVGLAGAVAEMLLTAAGVLHSTWVDAGLIVAAAALLVLHLTRASAHSVHGSPLWRGLRHGSAHLTLCCGMTCLQLLAPDMNGPWMLIVGLGVLCLALLSETRTS